MAQLNMAIALTYLGQISEAARTYTELASRPFNSDDRELAALISQAKLARDLLPS